MPRLIAHWGFLAGCLFLAAASGISLVQSQPIPRILPPAKEVDSAPTLRLPLISGRADLDPHRIRDEESLLAVSLMYDTLYMWVPGEHPTVVPALAKGWPDVSDDGMTVTIRLRENAFTHPYAAFGETRSRPVNARDAAESIMRASRFHAEGLGWMIDGLIDGLDEWRDAPNSGERPAGVSTPDEFTLQLRLSRPYAPLVTLLAHPCFSVVPVEVMDGAAGRMRDRGFGSGPYRLRALAEGEFLIFERFERHWGEKPDFQRITLAYWSDPKQDVATGTLARVPITPESLPRFVDGDGLTAELQKAGCRLETPPSPGYLFLAFNMQSSFFGADSRDGDKLRRAISLALNRESILDHALWSRFEWSTQKTVFPAGMEFHDIEPGRDFGRHNLDEAIALLADTRFAGGRNPATGEQLELDLLASDVEWQNSIVAELRNALNALGIRLLVRHVPADEARAHAADADQDMFFAGWFLDYPDPVNWLQLFYSGHIGIASEFCNLPRYASEDYDRLYAELESLLPAPENRQRRRELTAAMAEELARQQPIIPLVQWKRAWVQAGNIAWPNMPAQTFNGLRFTRRKQD